MYSCPRLPNTGTLASNEVLNLIEELLGLLVFDMCTQLRYWTVDGALFAQPLYVPDLVVNGSILNLVFAATEHSSVYAFNSGNSQDKQIRTL